MEATRERWKRDLPSAELFTSRPGPDSAAPCACLSRTRLRMRSTCRRTVRSHDTTRTSSGHRASHRPRSPTILAGSGSPSHTPFCTGVVGENRGVIGDLVRLPIGELRVFELAGVLGDHCPVMASFPATIPHAPICTEFSIEASPRNASVSCVAQPCHRERSTSSSSWVRSSCASTDVGAAAGR